MIPQSSYHKHRFFAFIVHFEGATMDIQRSTEETMIKKLTKHGNSYALIIDRGVMDLLQISEKTALYVTTDGKSLIVSPVQSEKRQKILESAVEHSFKKFGKAYKNLAG
jgi:antitoxin component of MazEF toxin-antitoxin module